MNRILLVMFALLPSFPLVADVKYVKFVNGTGVDGQLMGEPKDAILRYSGMKNGEAVVSDFDLIRESKNVFFKTEHSRSKNIPISSLHNGDVVTFSVGQGADIAYQITPTKPVTVKVINMTGWEAGVYNRKPFVTGYREITGSLQHGEGRNVDTSGNMTGYIYLKESRGQNQSDRIQIDSLQEGDIITFSHAPRGSKVFPHTIKHAEPQQPVAPAPAQPYKEREQKQGDVELQKLRDENSALQARLRQLEAEVARLKQENAELKAQWANRHD